MFANITDRLVERLEAEGIKAGRAYPTGSIVPPEGCFVRARLSSLERSDSGFAAYLGTEQDDGGGEVYGMRCRARVELDIYASCRDPQAARSCEALVDDIILALDKGGGLSISSFSCEGLRADRDTGCLLCPCSAQMELMLITRTEENEAQFSDFILKGEIRK